MALRARLESGFHRRRPLFWMTLSFCAGIWLDDLLALAPSLPSLIAFFAVSLAAAILVAWRFRRLAFSAGLASALILGTAVHAMRFRIHSSDDVAVRTPDRACFACVRGTIVEREWRASRGTLSNVRGPSARVAWTVAVDALGRDAGSLSPASGKIRVSIKVDPHADETASAGALDVAAAPENERAAHLAEGDRIEFRALIEPLPLATLPDGFDYGGYLAGQGVQRVGTVAPAALRKLSGPRWWQIGLRLRRFSGELASRTEALLSGHAEQAGLLNAMIFARREALTVTDREAFAIAGTAHLLAISGLHIQLVCAALWRALGWFGVSRRKSAVGVLAACGAYCLLTGATPPAVRATVMFAAYVAASIVQREAEPLSTLGAAALVVLVNAPQELFSAGFQLSFLAVLSLHTLLPAFEYALEQWRSTHAPALMPLPGEPLSWLETIRGWAGKSMLVTLAAWLATSPSVAWHMGRFSTLGLFVNLLALPFLGVCMMLGSATLATGYFWPAAGKVFGWAAWLSLTGLERINAACAGVSFASVDMPRPHPLSLVIYAASLAWLWITREAGASYKRLLCVVPACLLLLVSNAFFRSRPSSPELTILDLQHGRAALIESSSGTALIDAGGSGQGLRIAEVLRRRGTRSIDLFVLTADEPGAIDGALELLPRVAIKRAILPRCKFPSEARRKLEALLTERKVPYAAPSASENPSIPAGVSWTFADDGPPADQPAANASTLCVRVSCGRFSVLFAEAKSGASLGRLLAKKPAKFQADVLRLTPGEYGRWPRETSDLIQRTGGNTIVAGTSANPEEASGIDFEALDARVLSPHRDGSIRIRAGTNGALEFKAFRGEWRDVN